MIEIKAESKDLGKQTEVNVNVKLHGSEKELSRELCGVLKAIYDRKPEILLDAIELHMMHEYKDIFDSLVEEVADDD